MRLTYSIPCVAGTQVPTLLHAADYYPYGSILRQHINGAQEKYLTTHHERDLETGLDYRGARYYDSDVARFLSLDPLAVQRASLSPYNYVSGNPISRIDPDGKLDDWVEAADGSIYWDNNANDQATTKAGEKYLGKTLTFNFNSYIDGVLWDGPSAPGVNPAGDKLTSTIVLAAAENDRGELVAVGTSHKVTVGETPVGTARNHYPGLGDGQNSFGLTQQAGANGQLGSFSLNFEQHASVPHIEEFGLNMMGYHIVNVAQKLSLSYAAGGTLNVNGYTDVFPSATLSINGSTVSQYNQPSFESTHGGRSFGDAYKPASWRLMP
ncbi:MAG: RHS repeat-associated core domain-containing protein [Flavobacteriales bacterium]